MRADESQPAVEVRRSSRRKRSVSAFQEGNKIIVAIPNTLTKAEEAEWVAKMVTKLAQRQTRRRPSDEALLSRAKELSLVYLGGAAQPATVAWSSNQNRRWGSCSLQDRAIRISNRLAGMPEYVLDYVLLHELTHLLHGNHGPGFWALLANYPHLDKARGFLAGVDYQAQQTPGAEAA